MGALPAVEASERARLRRRETQPAPTAPGRNQAGKQPRSTSCIGCLLLRSTAPEAASPQTSASEAALSDTSAGAPLDPVVQRQMEQRLGGELSQARLHTDDRAAELSLALGARAFARGPDVYFGRDVYRPGTAVGDRILTHELVHVIQQPVASVGHQPAVSTPDHPMELEADRISAGGAGPPETAPGLGRPVIMRFWDEISSGLSSIGSAIGSAGEAVGSAAVSGARWVGGEVASAGRAVGSAAVSGARWVGGKLVRAGEAVADYIGSSPLVQCLASVGVAIGDLYTGGVEAVVRAIGLEMPERGSPRIIGVILAVLQHPCIRAAVSLLLPPWLIGSLTWVQDFLIGLLRLIDDPSLLLVPIKAALQQMVAQVPDEAMKAITMALRAFGGGMERHAVGIWDHLEPKLAYLLDHWWEVLKDSIWEMIWPFGEAGSQHSADDIKQIVDGFWTAWDNFRDGNWSRAFNGVIDLWRGVNNLAGRLYLWWGVLTVLIATVLGAIFGAGVGAGPAFLGALELVAAVGEGLLISTVAAEGLNITKSLIDLATERTDAELEDDYERISTSALTLGIIGVMYVVGEIASTMVKAILSRLGPWARRAGARLGLGKGREAVPGERPPPTLEERMQAFREAAAERERQRVINERMNDPRTRANLAAEEARMPAADREFLADPRNRELAFDASGDRGWRLDEARAALKAEGDGTLPRPVRRATAGDIDFIDGQNVGWNHKGVAPDQSVESVINDMRNNMARGNVLADLSRMSPSDAALVRQALEPLSGQAPLHRVVVVTPPAVTPSPGVVGGLAGKQMGSKVR